MMLAYCRVVATEGDGLGVGEEDAATFAVKSHELVAVGAPVGVFVGGDVESCAKTGDLFGGVAVSWLEMPDPGWFALTAAAASARSAP